jgi:hypothetical protein
VWADAYAVQRCQPGNGSSTNVECSVMWRPTRDSSSSSSLLARSWLPPTSLSLGVYLGGGAFRMCGIPGIVAQWDRTPSARWQSRPGRSQQRLVRSGSAIGSSIPGTVVWRGIDEQMAAVKARLSRTPTTISRIASQAPGRDRPSAADKRSV